MQKQQEQVALAFQALNLQSQFLILQRNQLWLQYQQALTWIEAEKAKLLLQNQKTHTQNQVTNEKKKDEDKNDWRLSSHSHFRSLMKEELSRCLKEQDVSRYIQHLNETDKKKLVSALEKHLYMKADSLANYIEHFTLKTRVVEALKKVRNRTLASR